MPQSTRISAQAGIYFGNAFREATAKKMLAMDFTLDVIEQVTGLTTEVLKGLK